MKRIAILGAVALIGLLPTIASARSRADVFFGFNFGPVGFVSDGFCATPAYTYCAPAPVVYSAPPIAVAPPTVVYSATPVVTCVPPTVVYAAPVCPPTVVYAPNVYYYTPGFYYHHGVRYIVRR